MLFATSARISRQPLFVPFGKLQNFSYLHPLNNNLSLVVTSRYSVPITFPPSDDTYNEIRQGKRNICQGNVRELSRNPSSDLADTLIYYLPSMQYLLPASHKIFFLLSRIATLYAALIQFQCKTRVVATFNAKVKDTVFQKVFLGAPPSNPLHFSLLQYPLPFQATLAATPVPFGKM